MAEYGEELTEREIELLQLVATGVTNRQVAQRLSISVNTVKVHLRNIYAKLGAESRTEATVIAVREGWVTVEGAEKTDATASTETAPAPQAPLVTPLPPLPLVKRIALIVALLLAVAGVVGTWPRSSPQADDGLSLPPNLEPDQVPPQVVMLEESPWQERAQMPTRRAHLALAAVGGRIFAIAGQTTEGTVATVEIYDPREDLWTRGNDKPVPAAYVSAAVIGTDVYVPGGCDADNVPTQTVAVYDARANSWSEVSPMPEPRCAYALAAWGETLYLFGGWDGRRYVATTFIYDAQTDTWSTGPPMSVERGLAAASPLANRLYVVGGYDGERELTTCAVYDPEAFAWEECAPLAVGREGLGLVTLSGQLYAIGGGGRTSYLGFNERYSLDRDAWSAIETPLVEEWRSLGTVPLDDAIYAIGGWSNGYLSLNQLYEPFTYRVFIPLSIPQQPGREITTPEPPGGLP
jgi:DNA-binding CsgD family transcriptional regulator